MSPLGDRKNTQGNDTQGKKTQRYARMKNHFWKARHARGKHPAQVGYVVGEILATCKDERSQRFYATVARRLPDEAIFRFLSEIRQDPRIRNRGAVFVAKVKRYLETHPPERPADRRA